MKDTPCVLRSVVRYDSAFESVKGKVSDVTVTVYYIGKAGIDGVRTGEVDHTNFHLVPSGTMT